MQGEIKQRRRRKVSPIEILVCEDDGTYRVLQTVDSVLDGVRAIRSSGMAGRYVIATIRKRLNVEVQQMLRFNEE